MITLTWKKKKKSSKVLYNKLLLSKMLLCAYMLSRFSQLFVILWTAARQAPLSMGFCRQEYWSKLPFPFPGNLPNPGTEPEPYVACTGRQVPYH